MVAQHQWPAPNPASDSKSDAITHSNSYRESDPISNGSAHASTNANLRPKIVG